MWTLEIRRIRTSCLWFVNKLCLFPSFNRYNTTKNSLMCLAAILKTVVNVVQSTANQFVVSKRKRIGLSLIITPSNKSTSYAKMEKYIPGMPPPQYGRTSWSICDYAFKIKVFVNM